MTCKFWFWLSVVGVTVNAIGFFMFVNLLPQFLSLAAVAVFAYCAHQTIRNLNG